jgi:FK506-binding protein 1
MPFFNFCLAKQLENSLLNSNQSPAAARREKREDKMGVENQTLKPGDQKNFPQAGQKLEMHYVGTLASNGQEFDSSYSRNKPFRFTIGVGQVIKGWDEGVMKMSKGEKAKLIISSDYAYGAEGAGGVIPPNADLIFEVELLDILA